MVTPEDVRALFYYNRGVLDAFERSLRRLTWRQLGRNREAGHLSLKDTYLHIVQVHDGWLNYIVPGRHADMQQRVDPYRLRSWREIRKWEAGVWRGIDQGLEALGASELRRVVKAPWMPGKYTVADAYFQTSFEQAHHLGEIIAMYWQMDRAPPDMTWIDIRRKAAASGSR